MHVSRIGRPGGVQRVGEAPRDAGRMRELSAGFNTGLLVAVQALTHGLVAFAPLGPAAMGFGMSAALATSAAAGVLIAVLGSSRPLIGTTTASTALITASVLGAAAPATMGAAIALAMLLALLAGVLMLGMTRAGLARAAALIPAPVTVGLLNGIVVLVVLGQGPIILGLLPGQGLSLAAVLPGSAVVGLLAAALILWPPPKLPAPLVAIGVAAGAHYLLAAAGVPLGPVVGVAPSLPLLADGLGSALHALGSLPPAATLATLLLPAAASLALLSMLEGLTAGAALRGETGRRGEARRDLLGSSAAMMAGGALGGVPASTLSAASIACFRWGGRGRGAMLARAALVLPVLGFAGPLLAQLPYAALAGVLIAAVLRLFKWRPLLPAAGPGRPRRIADALVIATVVAGAVVFGLVGAVGLGVLLAVVIFTASMTQSVIRRSTRNPAGRSRVRRPIEQQEALRGAGERIQLVELEGALFFGTAEQVLLHVEQVRKAGAEVVILDLGRVTRIDLSGAHRLVEICRAAPGGILIAPLHPGSRAAAELEAVGMLGQIPKAARAPDLAGAVEAAEEAVLAALQPQAGAPPGPAEALAALGLPATAVAALLPRMREESFADGSALLRRGEAADAAFLLMDGQALVSLPAGHGQASTRLAVLAPGVIFGEAALLGAERRIADVTARGAVRCLRLPLAEAEALRREDPETSSLLMTAVARQLAGNVAAANAAIDQLES